ncbi:uncharacterized protein BDR25DRAFT_251018 [Lindgomyces ingoldianus]|uniref:Uncharacterized protein n=1 Tax=Lindgomyces ingoldianus TaxID=673940 RepID=A0ACB6RIW1_9PLEO|nr:uncharacterized protein BDR25DRAFT_251018 [Lindgomyces ingoldianus]KAF2478280.1 hypothetical protein BDR25DRAFT_251018 [Lindgomyces ingoldianus]
MALGSLKNSKWADRTPAEAHVFTQEQRIAQEKEKATRLLGRLRWKAESLIASYNRALDILSTAPGNLDGRHLRYPFMLGLGVVSPAVTPHEQAREAEMQKRRAESMFKLDFFEFYALLERYITQCLSILGVHVTANALGPNIGLRLLTNPNAPRTVQSNGMNQVHSSHRFHENLLEMLDQGDNPLHQALGRQDVRIQLGRAKEYRNKWKDADEKLTVSKWTPEDDPIKLRDLDLERMLSTIFGGLEHAQSVVNQSLGNSGMLLYQRDVDIDDDSMPYEYMYDPMDLD